MKPIVKIVSLLFIPTMIMFSLIACEDNNDDTNPVLNTDIIGIWQNESWGVFDIRENGTATEYYEENGKMWVDELTYIYDYDLDILVFFDEDGNLEYRFSVIQITKQTLLFEYEGRTLEFYRRYSLPTTNGNSNNNNNGDNNGGGNSGGNTGGSNTSQNLATLLRYCPWTWYNSSSDCGSFAFYNGNQISFITSGYSSIASHGYPTLVATGTFSIDGNNIYANFNDISIDPAISNAFSQFPGWTVGSTKSVTYTIKSISENRLTLSDGTKTWYLEPF